MTDKNNATCKICGNPYYLCLSCRDSINLSPWKVHTDTAEHYKIYQILRGYSTKVYTKEEARDKLKNVDLRDLESFKEPIKLRIKEILKEKKIELEIESEVKTENETESKVEIEVEPERVKSTRKKYSKVGTE